jgi:integrase
MPYRHGWWGRDRGALVRVMTGTGLRVNECRSLTPESFRLMGGPPFVTVEAAYTKNRQPVEQPIPARDVVELALWLKYKTAGKPVFPMGRNFKMSEMMQAVCRRAGVPYRDAEGFLDGHALRHSYITNLAQRTDLKTVQSLARHGDAKMTLRYMHTDDDKRRKAVEGQ